MKEVIWQTTEVGVDFHDRYWKNVSDEGMPGRLGPITAYGNTLI